MLKFTLNFNKKMVQKKSSTGIAQNPLLVAVHSPSRSDLKNVVKCTRCKNKHTIGERVCKRSDPVYLIWIEVCPRCACKSYYANGN